MIVNQKIAPVQAMRKCPVFCNAIIFEIANCKVQIENFIFPIFIFQLFFTFYESGNIASHLEARAPLQVRDKHAPLAQVQSAH